MLTGYPSFCQQIFISGKVMDKNTRENIPFAAVHFPGTDIGTTTNEKGYYSFRLARFPSDTLSVSELGYRTINLVLNRSLKSQTINFYLVGTNVSLSEFVIHAGVNPALILLHKIILHKPENNQDNIHDYKSQVYNKLEVDLDQINKSRFEKSAIFKPFVFILNNVDSSSEKTPFLPVFLSETFSDYYYQKNPRREKEIIVATHRSGLKNKSLTQFLTGIYQKVNIYDNFIPVFGKEFPSPISDFGTTYYNYQITDTQFIDHRKCFHLSFTPRRKGETAFFGDLWVNDTTFAIQSIHMQISADANINFVRRIDLVEKYTPLNKTRWFQTESKLIADFVLTTKRSMGMIARNTTISRLVAINDTAATHIFDDKKYRDEAIYILPGAREKKDSFWISHRLEKLTKSEGDIFKMVDTLQEMPVFKEYSNIFRFITTGKAAWGPIAVGPYYYLFNINPLEKYRVRIGLSTTTQFSKDIYLHSYLAYGFGDKRFKGEIGGRWLINSMPYRYIDFSYIHDLDNGSFHQNGGIGVDNIFSFALRKPGTMQKFVMLDEQKLVFYNELSNGFSQKLFLVHAHFDPFAPLPGIKYFPSVNITEMNPLNDVHIGIRLRYAYGEKFLYRNSYHRISLGSKYPIVALNYQVGLRDVFNSAYRYQKAGFSIHGKFKIPPLGTIHYNLYGKKTFGTLPYLLLNILPGNDFYYYNKHLFNLMDRYQFMGDEYAGFFIEHDIGGGIFSYIPGIRHLKLRQFWTARGVMGHLSKTNQELNLHNGYAFETLNNNPYLEIGTGIGNIFQLIRIEGIWRVTPSHLQHSAHNRRLGIFASLTFQF